MHHYGLHQEFTSWEEVLLFAAGHRPSTHVSGDILWEFFDDRLISLPLAGQSCQVIMRKFRVHVRKAIRRRLKNPTVCNTGIKIKRKTLPAKNFLPFFYKYTEFNFFHIFLTFLSQNYRPHHCKNTPIPLY